MLVELFAGFRFAYLSKILAFEMYLIGWSWRRIIWLAQSARIPPILLKIVLMKCMLEFAFMFVFELWLEHLVEISLIFFLCNFSCLRRPWSTTAWLPWLHFRRFACFDEATLVLRLTIIFEFFAWFFISISVKASVRLALNQRLVVDIELASNKLRNIIMANSPN